MSNAWRIVLIKRYSPNLQCHTIGCLIVLFGLRVDSVAAFCFHIPFFTIDHLGRFYPVGPDVDEIYDQLLFGFFADSAKKNCENKVGQTVSNRRNHSMFVRANDEKKTSKGKINFFFFRVSIERTKKLRPWPFRCNYHQARAEADKQLSKVELVKA